MKSPHLIRSLFTRKPSRRRRFTRIQTAQRVESLEDRTLLSAFAVTNTGDAGAGSLRQAILDANANAGADTIEFNLSAADPNFIDVDSALPGGDAAADVFVIRPLSALPALDDATGGTTIDGRTQTAFGGDTNPFGPEIVLDGSLAGATDGIAIRSDDNAVFGLNIQQFSRDGIDIFGGDGNHVAGNYIGTDATGTLDRGNGQRGILVWGGGVGNVIGTDGDGTDDAAERNVIAGNSGSGVRIFGAGTDQTVVAGNHLGVDVTGTVDLGNGARGVQIDTGPAGNRVGTNGDGVSDVIERNVISGNSAEGILISNSDGNVVAGNFIGTDVTGTADLGNSRGGVQIQNGAEFNRIGTNGDGSGDTAERNVISGNNRDGVVLLRADNNVLAGNYVGLDATGTAALANSSGGVRIHNANNSRIGTNGDGTADTAERNVISANRSGITMTGVSSLNVIAGNYIGTNAAGDATVGNAVEGILVRGSTSSDNDPHSNRIGTNGDGVADEAERNVIAGHRQHGIRLTATHDNVVAGNYVGTDATGTVALGNQRAISVDNGSQRNRIGTNADGVSDNLERNVLSGNTIWGVIMFTPETTDNVVAGNYIGVDATGAGALGNGVNGVFIAFEANGNRIGTDGDGVGDSAEGNVIAFSGEDGVRVREDAVGNSIRGNSIYANGELGIDLTANVTDDEVTPNDAGDADTGGNNLQNFPEIKNAVSLPQDRTLVVGTIDATPNTTLTIDFYASAVADPSGFGEGQRWLGSLVVTTDDEGIADFTTILTAASTEGEVLTATATAADGSTSEFSQAFVIKETTDGNNGSAAIAGALIARARETATATLHQDASGLILPSSATTLREPQSVHAESRSARSFKRELDLDGDIDSEHGEPSLFPVDDVFSEFELLGDLLAFPLR